LALSARKVECYIDHIREVISHTISLCYFKNFVYCFKFSVVEIFNFSAIIRRYGLLIFWTFV
jgi:hypothetical protein